MQSLILLWVLATTFYYLGARASITQFLWSRYPKSFDKFMDCPACSGFWYGAAIAFAFILCDRDLPLGLTPDALSVLVCGWLSIALTPIGAAILTRALVENGSAADA